MQCAVLSRFVADGAIVRGLSYPKQPAPDSGASIP